MGMLAFHKTGCSRRPAENGRVNHPESRPDLPDLAVPQGVLFGLCGRVFFGLDLPQVKLVVRSLRIGRMSQLHRRVIRLPRIPIL